MCCWSWPAARSASSGPTSPRAWAVSPLEAAKCAMERWSAGPVHEPCNMPERENIMMSSPTAHRRRALRGAGSALALSLALGIATPAAAQDAPAAPAEAPAANQKDAGADQALPPQTDQAPDNGSETDIFSRRTISVLLDARLAFSNGHTSWVDGGLGKTRFGGAADGGYKFRAVPVEADLVWTPRFTNALSANVSGAWQRDQENGFDLIEAFVTWLPQSSGKVNFSARAGLIGRRFRSSTAPAGRGAWSTPSRRQRSIPGSARK